MTNLPKNITIQQRIEILEALTDIEAKNKYTVSDADGNILLYAYETSSLFLRLILPFKHMRPLKLTILDTNKQKIMTLDRPFYMLKSKHILRNAQQNIIGYVKQKKWFFLRTEFEVYNGKEEHLFTCYHDSIKSYKDVRDKKERPSKFMLFHAMKDGKEIAQFSWTLNAKELVKFAFTDANNISIDNKEVDDHKTKWMILATAFAFDLRHLEW